MKCPNCQMELNENNNICSNCNTVINNQTNVIASNSAEEPVVNNEVNQTEIAATTPGVNPVNSTPAIENNTTIVETNVVNNQPTEVLETKKSNNKIVLIILLIIIVIALISTLVVSKPWTKFGTNNKNEASNNNNTNTNVNNNSNNINTTTPTDESTMSDDIQQEIIVPTTPSDEEMIPEQTPIEEQPNEEQTPSVEEPEEEKPQEQEPTKEPEEETPTEEETPNEEPVVEMNDMLKRIYVNYVIELINFGETQFMTDALRTQGTSIAYTNLSAEKSFPTYTLDEMEDANYYIEFDRNGRIKRALYYKEHGCYDSGDVNDLEKSDVTIDNIVSSHPNDSINGCVNKK